MTRPYKKLNLQCQLPEDLEDAINRFMDYIIHDSGSAEDCYRSEIDIWLKDAKDKLPKNIYEQLKSYYVHGGIYNGIGDPYQWDREHV